MLIKAKTLTGYKIDSLDGDIGKVIEFYFDDKFWTIRYLIVDTGNWLKSRKVLISPQALNSAIPSEKHLSVDLTKKQIEQSPSCDTDKPVSRQFEEAYYGYYQWPTYWSGSYIWGAYPNIIRDRSESENGTQQVKAWDYHLRSTDDVDGHHVQATDGEIGHVEDFVIDDDTWTIRYLIINTKNWWPGKRVLVSPEWISRVSWNESKVYIDLSRESIKSSPEYSEDILINRDYETSLYHFYNRKGYWANELELV